MDANFQLVPFAKKYSQELFALTNENRQYLRQWLPWLDAVQRPEDSARFIEQNLISDQQGLTLNYFIFCEERLIGTIGLRSICGESAEVGYWIAEKFQKRGIVSAALAQIISDVIDTKLTQKIILRCNPNNHSSASVAKRCGFSFSHTLEKAENLYGTWHDLDVYVKTI